LDISWKIWLTRDIAIVPMAIFILGAITGSVFLLNLSLPFLIVYGFSLNQPEGGSLLVMSKFAVLIMFIDIIYAVMTDVKLKPFFTILWGLLAGVLLFLIYHKLLFGDINLRLPVLKIYRGLIDRLEKIF
jgi:hypothetical protein